MEKITCNDSTHNAIAFVERNIESWKPIRKLTVFFENSNFLLTPYKLSHTGVNAILETFTGTLIEFSGFTCGYSGQGSSGTAKLLAAIGVDIEIANKLRLEDGLQVTFNYDINDKVDHNVNYNVFFNKETRNKDYCGCNLGNHTIASVVTRDIYMINPEQHNIVGLLNCLHVMKPQEIEYLIGHGVQDYLSSVQENPSFKAFSNRQYLSSICGFNLIIRGEQFDLKCWVDTRYIQSVLNAIFLHLHKRGLFEETQLGNATIMKPYKQTKIGILLNLFSKNKILPHAVLDVSDKELKKGDTA